MLHRFHVHQPLLLRGRLHQLAHNESQLAYYEDFADHAYGWERGHETMHIHKAFYHAVAHGYRLPGKATHFGGVNAEYSLWTLPETQSSFMIPVQETFLDPHFWQTLGQALGWETPCHVCIACSQEDACTVRHGYYWMYQWHCFIQHLADGKTAESFFATLSTSRRSPEAPKPGPQPSHRLREDRHTLY